MLWSLLLLSLLLQLSTGEFEAKVATQYNGVTRIKCESLLYRTVYFDSNCYFVIDSEVDFDDTSNKCAKVLAGAKISDNTPDYVWSSLEVNDPDFQIDKSSTGKKKAMCKSGNPFSTPTGSLKSTDGGIRVEMAKLSPNIIAQVGRALIVPLTTTPVPGQVIIIKGVVHPQAATFLINIGNHNGSWGRPAEGFAPIPLHFIFEFKSGKVNFNTCAGGPPNCNWGPAQTHQIPFTSGEFDIRIRFHSDRFETFVNLKKFADYAYRIPMHLCKSLWIDGEVYINYVDIGEKNNVPLPYSIASAHSNAGKSVDFDKKMLTDQMPLPFTKQFDEQIEAGYNLTVKGGVASNVDQFVVNLQNNVGTVIAVHFNFRFNTREVILCTAPNFGQWGQAEVYALPINKGDAFEFVFIFRVGSVQIFVNQKAYAVYNYRLPLTAITAIHVGGLGYLTLVKLEGNSYRPVPINHEINSFPVCGERYCTNQALQTTSSRNFESFLRRLEIKGCKSLYVTGFVFSTPNRGNQRVEINLIRKNGDIALQVNPDFTKKVVLLNSRKDGKKMDAVVVEKFPFKYDEIFEVTITNEALGFQIFVNNEFLATLPHRMCNFDISIVDTQGIQALGIRN